MGEDVRALLGRLVEVAGPSGFEMPVAEVFRETARGFAGDVRGDTLGSAFATVNAGGRPRVALMAHLDEIGFLVSHVDERGMLLLSPVRHLRGAGVGGPRGGGGDPGGPRAP